MLAASPRSPVLSVLTHRLSVLYEAVCPPDWLRLHFNPEWRGVFTQEDLIDSERVGVAGLWSKGGMGGWQGGHMLRWLSCS